MNKYYKYSIMARARILLGFLLTEIILLAIAQHPDLKYVMWIPIIGIGIPAFINVWYRFKAIFKIDDIGFTSGTYKAELKIPWEEIAKINVSKRREKVGRITVFREHKTLKKVAVIDKNIKNYKELIATILSNVESINEKFKKDNKNPIAIIESKYGVF